MTLFSPSNSTSSTIEWSTQLDIKLFQSMKGLKPIGIHKHFRIIQITKKFNKISEIKLSTSQIWDRLNYYFNCEELDQMNYLSDDESNGNGSKTNNFKFNLLNYTNYNFETLLNNRSRKFIQGGQFNQTTTTGSIVDKLSTYDGITEDEELESKFDNSDSVDFEPRVTRSSMLSRRKGINTAKKSKK
ncbi:hypothetical protein CONCODRAFT_13363 [Conidiobolus coronatus NRRL 28638]|uniref:Chromatin modification-related protein EAF7 n=1 Tax=Conidiobolus coronatus (strain ATCC 28846 / CBS 209.66 / NRRL 28638) TaxID=796925 RepID=A0A137NQW2_CONC2|nr:hypothetical protein CONCODRAFT_13363 [Conidiobolus coronatus NRRL 28638]|eukprot:KXN65153.1 hypothetical protein CONCODRAFT_13363 [Conidiobolus coronatus NRRL 28638]